MFLFTYLNIFTMLCLTFYLFTLSLLGEKATEWKESGIYCDFSSLVFNLAYYLFYRFWNIGKSKHHVFFFLTEYLLVM